MDIRGSILIIRFPYQIDVDEIAWNPAIVFVLSMFYTVTEMPLFLDNYTQ